MESKQILRLLLRISKKKNLKSNNLKIKEVVVLTKSSKLKTNRTTFGRDGVR